MNKRNTYLYEKKNEIINTSVYLVFFSFFVEWPELVPTVRRPVRATHELVDDHTDLI